MYRSFLKRVFDFLIATVVFIIALPLFGIVTILLFIVNKGKPFFLQERPGKGEQIFKVIKFKTMTDDRDVDGKLLPDNLRMTRIGRFVRKTSLDEIPQLLNVIKGDMSLIGPRPLLVSYLSLYNEIQKRRHEIRPGITGWAQVNGRNAISWEQKFNYDVWYIDHYSFLLDIKIILLTLFKVFKSEGINAEDSIPMRPFMGTIENKMS
ncbi:sugar transferase [Agriterribacter sp.]|uniref:sugar transferase n=1 Tax=Agriterribacter sp. TaxID=2821509 RepID=UPI002B54B68E|nr:sugar transferase [Agriterribacter sp.]HRO48267.1 sugar transferase [Agriterribacter sp.]HRQ18092.1 sugar transferase [Agriterribacter sp.]